MGSLAAAAFLIRDGGVPGSNITIFEAAPVVGGSLDGGGSPGSEYTLCNGRVFTSDNYECTLELFKTILSLEHEGLTVFDEFVAFNGASRGSQPSPRRRDVDRFTRHDRSSF